MAKQDKVLLMIGLIIVGFILYNSPQEFTIYKPVASSDSDLQEMVNNWYFPIGQKVNIKKPTVTTCQNVYIDFGSSTAFDSTTIPRNSAGCIFAEDSSYFFEKRYISKDKSCNILGTEVEYGKSAIFTKIKLLKNNDTYYFCKETRTGIEYSKFSKKDKLCLPSKFYTLPNKPDPEGTYTCDESSGTIYFIPCGKRNKAKVVEKCSLGCTDGRFRALDLDFRSIDESGGYVQFASCNGDYKPNKNQCSSDGKILYQTNSAGNLKKTRCCSCTDGVCNREAGNCSYVVEGCYLVAGNGNSDNIDVVLYNDDEIPDYWEWVQYELNKTVPYNEFDYNFYREYPTGKCDSTIQYKANDVKIGFGDLGHMGWGQPTDSSTKPGVLTIDTYVSNKKWEFLLFHELGHIYTHASHTCDGSLMDASGGDGQYRPYQITLIRKNLNSESPIWDSSYKTCGK